MLFQCQNSLVWIWVRTIPAISTCLTMTPTHVWSFDRLTTAPAGDDSDVVSFLLTTAVGVAMLNTLLAAGGGGWLVWQQLWHRHVLAQQQQPSNAHRLFVSLFRCSHKVQGHHSTTTFMVTMNTTKKTAIPIAIPSPHSEANNRPCHFDSFTYYDIYMYIQINGFM